MVSKGGILNEIAVPGILLAANQFSKRKGLKVFSSKKSKTSKRSKRSKRSKISKKRVSKKSKRSRKSRRRK